MSRWIAALAIGVCLVTAGACEDDDSPTTSPNDLRLIAGLSPFNEVPAVTNADRSGSGLVEITLHVTRNAAGAITAATADFEVALTGFPTGTTLTGAHIHPGVAGVNGGVAVTTGIASGEIVLTNGAGSFTRNGISVTPTTAQNIISNPAGFYFNVHTVLSPPGAARGQLQTQ